MTFWKIAITVTIIVTALLFQLTEVQTLPPTAPTRGYVNLDKEAILWAGPCEVYAKKYSCIAARRNEKMYLLALNWRMSVMYQLQRQSNGKWVVTWSRTMA